MHKLRYSRIHDRIKDGPEAGAADGGAVGEQGTGLLSASLRGGGDAKRGERLLAGAYAGRPDDRIVSNHMYGRKPDPWDQ
jgi:hypothetical protein